MVRRVPVEWVVRRLLHPRLTRLAATSAPMKPKVFLASKVRLTWCRLATSSACATTRLMCRVAPSGLPSTTAWLVWSAQDAFMRRASRFYATARDRGTPTHADDGEWSRGPGQARIVAYGCAWPRRSAARAPRLSQGVNEAKLSSCRMADGDEIQRLMCSGQSEHPLHLVILERAYWSRSQIHCDGLQ